MTAAERELHVGRLLTLIGVAAENARNSIALEYLARASAQQARIVQGDRLTLAKIEAGGVVANGQAQAYERANQLARQVSGELTNMFSFVEALKGVLADKSDSEPCNDPPS